MFMVGFSDDTSVLSAKGFASSSFAFVLRFLVVFAVGAREAISGSGEAFRFVAGFTDADFAVTVFVTVPIVF